MIKFLTGRLLEVYEEAVIIEVGAFQFEVFVPDFVRRNLQPLSGDDVGLHTVFYFDGNPQGKITPRMVGFLNKVELEFFELFCSVDGVGVKKALRAMVRPVREIAQLIEDQDVKGLTTLPGVGPAMSERIIARLRRKMAKFALLVAKDSATAADIEPDIVEQTCDILCNLGHSESDARHLVEKAIASGEKFKDVESLINAVYQSSR
ncbi:MAG: Holliday junction DNA helicase RuvA [Planctomycetaceae bacterium]|jgi:Holliday junction DNA helicase RuvA|nr:Holliday junction DNA helicase RuvA [Planctomycetaceae bacterium]|tara:strand:+ start:2252 stop:2869 length:618 start_codon:yes stop_codon:yes gene_type:complete